ncbi:unnamed protein product [Cylicocyclus nassatus]|uniref:Carboxylesterase type B domain-containing protein n=1 Tax=Cylicocyclus nassatus TaxID=53992 RepID=A0AA36M6L3_CYLNA|nr:unnamed protein product [Cylicocyclus nassatus]
MLDQVQALQWINSEISNFGGDPRRITLCGQGYGGCAVSAHTLSPLSQNLFQQAIIQSGPLLSCYSPTLSYPATQDTQGTTYTSTSSSTVTTPAAPQYDTGMSYVPWQNTTSTPSSYTAYPTLLPQTQTEPPAQGYTGYPPETTPTPSYGGGGPTYATGDGAYPADSGYSSSPSNIAYDDVSPSQQLAQELCNITAEQWRTGQLGDLSNCLHNYTVDVFIKTEGAKKATWMIVRDDTFLPDTLQNLAVRRPPIPIIIGTVEDEDADYAFKLVADGKYNENEGQLYNTWLMDFAKKNKLNDSTVAQISDIITQSYNITTGDQHYDVSGTISQYGGVIGDANQEGPSQGTSGHANEGAMYDPYTTTPGYYYTMPTGSVDQQAIYGYSPTAPSYSNQGAYGSPTPAAGYGNQQGGYDSQNSGYQSEGETPSQTTISYSGPNAGYGGGYGYTTSSYGYGGPSGGQYPTQSGGYSPQGPGAQNSGYMPQRTPGYDAQNSGYSSQSSGYSNQNYGYGNQQGGYNQGSSGYGPSSQYQPQYEQNTGYGSGGVPISTATNQSFVPLKIIIKLQADSGIVSQTASDIDCFMQNGNQDVRVYQFTHVTDLGRQNVPNLGTWKPVYKGQDMIFLFMSETIWVPGSPTSNDVRMADQMGERWTQFAKEGQVSGWQPSNPQVYNYCSLNYQPTIQTGYAEDARTIFNSQVYPIVHEAQGTTPLYDQSKVRQPLSTGAIGVVPNPMSVNYTSNGPNSNVLHISFRLNNVPGTFIFSNK